MERLLTERRLSFTTLIDGKFNGRMEIEYVNHGIGNRFGELIELNEELKKYPELHKAILNHEIRHTDKPGFNRKDLMIDLTETKVDKYALLKFMIKNPKSFSQFLPCYWTKKHGFVYDLNIIVIYGVLITIVSVGAYFAFIL